MLLLQRALIVKAFFEMCTKVYQKIFATNTKLRPIKKDLSGRHAACLI